MLTLFLHVLILACTASAELPELPSGLDYRIDANLTYFSSSSNFVTGGGSEEGLINGGTFTDMIGKATYTQDLDKSMRVYGGATYSRTESYDGVNTRTNSGANELLAGGQMWFKLGAYQLVGAGDFVYPLFEVDRNSDTALLGEGVMKLRGGGWFIWPLGDFSPFVNLSYEYRGGGRSHSVPYAIGAKYKMGRQIWLQGEYRGYEKLINNEDSENPTTREFYLKKVDGGSYRYFSMNPALSELAASAGYSFGTISAYVEGAYTVNGSSAAAGWTGMIGLAYVPGGKISDYESAPSPSRLRTTEPIEDSSGFTESGDGMLSEPDPRVPPPAAPASRRQTTPARPKPSLKVKRPKSKKDKLDKMLNNTEKTLQGL